MKKMTTDRKVILYIATSLDGYIAKPNDDLSFLSIVQQEGEDYGYGDLLYLYILSIHPLLACRVESGGKITTASNHLTEMYENEE